MALMQVSERTLAQHQAQSKKPFCTGCIPVSGLQYWCLGHWLRKWDLWAPQVAVGCKKTKVIGSSDSAQPAIQFLNKHWHQITQKKGTYSSTWVAANGFMGKEWGLKEGKSSRMVPAGKWRAACAWGRAPTYVVMIFSRGSGGRPTVSCLWCDRRSVHAYHKGTKNRRPFSESYGSESNYFNFFSNF